MSTAKEGKPFKVAIIGGGIGGASTAFHLRNTFGPQVGITLFEQSNYLGGRMKSVTYAGKHYEAGAIAFSVESRYMMAFTKAAGLQFDDESNKYGVRLGLFSGAAKHFSFSTLQNNGLVATLRTVLHYGTSLLSVKSKTKAMLTKFSKIYELQDRGQCFTTPAELIKAVHPEFLEMTKWKYSDWLTQRERMSDLLKEELLYGIVSNNYCQDLDVHAFLGLFTTATCIGKVNSVKNGNQLVPEKLIQSALEQNPEGYPSSFVHAQVTNISPDKDTRYRIEYCPHESNSTKEDVFDYVVIAAPLHQQSTIKARGNIALPSYQYQAMDKTIMAGDLKPSVFGITIDAFKSNICAFILPTRTAYLQNLCHFHSLTGIPNQEKGSYTWITFSEPSRISNPEQLIADKYIDVSGPEAPLRIKWLASPVYQALTRPAEQLGSFVLAPRLYYANAIEQIASCMEMAAIGGRNVALLIAADRETQK